MALQYDPSTGRYLNPYEIRMQTLASRNAASDSGVDTAKGGGIQPSAKEIDWTGDSNLKQNEGVVGLEGSEMEGKLVGDAAAAKNSGAMGGGVAAAQTAMNGGGALDVAGSGMTAAGMYSANPYLVGAGLGVSALSAVQKGKNQREQNKYLAEVNKFQARQAALSKLASLGQGLKA